MSHYHNDSWFTGYFMILNTEIQWLENKEITEYSELLSGYSSGKVSEATNDSSSTDGTEHLASPKHITLLAILPNVTWCKPQYGISYTYEWNYVPQLKRYTDKPTALTKIPIRQGTVTIHYVPQLKTYTDKPTKLTEITTK